MALALTLANIVLIFVASIMFYLKELLPFEKHTFWHDLKAHRHLIKKDIGALSQDLADHLNEESGKEATDQPKEEV